MRTSLWVCTLGLMGWMAGCSGEDTFELPDTDEPDTTTPEPTADTAPDEAPIEASEVRFIAFIGWDAATQEIVDVEDEDGNGFISAYIIDLFIEEGNFDDSNRCRIALRLAGLEAVKDPGEDYIWGLDIPPGQIEEAQENCIERGFDPAQFDVKGDPIQTWASWAFTLRLGGDLEPENADWIKGSFGGLDDFTLDWYVQGGWRMDRDDAGFTTGDDDNFWYGRAMDNNYVVDFDSRRVKQDYVTPAQTLSTGYYVFDQRVHLDMPLGG